MVNEAGRLTSRLPELQNEICKDQRQQSINTKLFQRRTVSVSRREMEMLAWKSALHAEKGQGSPERGRGRDQEEVLVKGWRDTGS